VIRINPRITLYILTTNYFITSQFSIFLNGACAWQKFIPQISLWTKLILYFSQCFRFLLICTDNLPVCDISFLPLPFCSHTFYSASSLLLYIPNCFRFVRVSYLVIPVYSLKFSINSILFTWYPCCFQFAHANILLFTFVHVCFIQLPLY
jgi:hypothetical protein